MKGRFKMFGKKKETGIPVQHYEGITGFATDYPCRIEVKDSIFEIRRLKPETTIILELNRIKSFTAMEESRFMLQYHGDSAKTSKGIGKYYLVIEYDKGMIAFWGTAKEYKQFLDLQNNFAPSTITL